MTTHELKVLVVDDHPPVVEALQVLFEVHGIPCAVAADPRSACARVARGDIGVVLQDMNFSPNQTSGHEGVQLFHALREVDSDLPILLMTAWASLESAVELVKEGAADYIEKPWQDDKLVATLSNLLELRRTARENQRLRDALDSARDRLSESAELGGLVYRSGAMQRVLELALSVAGSDAPVLITGPSGSGKERVAEIIQRNSRRRDRPFVRVNVGAIPESLMEAELFGAEAGAYTGISSRRIGHFEAAHGGTLFLDEIDSLSLQGQVALLRILASGEFQRLGSSRIHRADVRVISATNADLGASIAAGSFRDDLYYRLNVVELAIPPLAEREEDVLPLARYFLLGHAEGSGARAAAFSREAEEALCTHRWPGNVRELDNRVQRATLVAQGPTILAEDLGLSAADGPSLAGLSPRGSAERQRVLELLKRHRGVVARAAAELGVSRQALYRKMSRLGIELERQPRGRVAP